MPDQNREVWRKCSACKKPIFCGTRYYVCSVSTCNGQRTGYVFCTFPCFETHLPGARHKQAGAVEAVAPMTPQAAGSESGSSAGPGMTSVESTERSPARILIRTPSSNASGGSSSNKNQIPREVLIIASRLKDYIHARAEYNTSASVMDVLSDHIRIICDRAIDCARAEGRKTVLDRDFDFLKNKV